MGTLPTEFSAAARAWFDAAFEAPTPVQARGWSSIATGAHTLLVAPTGSGKTLAAFLWGIDRLSRIPAAVQPGYRVLYVSPLKALVYDVQRNLRAPIAGITQAAQGLGQDLPRLRVDVRTGDTMQAERRRQAREPGDILITTPESLYLLLGSKAARGLARVHTLIVDEVHSLAPVKRGAHLALSLERMEELSERAPQRIGLSATVRPLQAAALYLGGGRPVELVDASAGPGLDLRVVVPVADMERPPSPSQERDGPLSAGGGSGERGIWSSIFPRLVEEIRAGRSSILFVNSRGLCERLTQRLNAIAGEPLVLAHHGSLSHARRAEIEDGLKSGRVRGIVATSSLELGVDMGAVDRVILVESPGSVARGLQRVGRAGHQVGAVSIGRIYPKFRGDLLECALIAQRMLAGEIESMAVPDRPLDVLAQQVAAMVCERPYGPDRLLRILRRAWSYRELSRTLLDGVLDMLSGHYPSTEMAYLRPLLNWDRKQDLLTPRRGAPMITRLNAGTIPDRGAYGVYLAPDGPRVGELDEEMVYESRAGEVITLGASSWRVQEITRDRVLVSPAPGEPGKLPFWHGDSPGRPMELGHALGAMLRTLDRLPRERMRDWLQRHSPLDSLAASNLADYLVQQKAACGTLPSDRCIVVERFRDELGDWRVCILSPFGARVHAPWALALQQGLERRSGFDVQVLYTDDGIALRLADAEQTPGLEHLLPDPEQVREQVTEQLADSALFTGLFRENAARALLMPKRAGSERRPLWAQRIKARQLLAAVRPHGDFPVVMETYRQCLADIFDLDGLEHILRALRARSIRMVEVETPRASPFARSLVFSYVAAHLYEQDAPLAERKAQALSLDRRLLAELLGQDELRTLIDPQVLEEMERELQHLEPSRQARDADTLLDLLRRLGDLNEEKLASRCNADPAPWLEQLHTQQRAVPLHLAGETRWIAAEEAGLYRIALGVVPPPGLPQDCLEAAEDPLPRLLLRYARVHGPFLTEQPARHYDLPLGQLEPVLGLLETQGRLLRGEIRPVGSLPEWCHPQVLTQLKRRSLARLRKQVAPVEAAALGRFLPAWQGLDQPGEGLAQAVRRLSGLALPWSDLLRVILPRRVPGFRPEELDLLCAAGEFIWVGQGALGARDGRIALYPREQAGQLLDPPSTETPGPMHQALLDHLARCGASFTLELRQAVPLASAAEFDSLLWDLVWEGHITNDTFAPLRGRLQGGGKRQSQTAGGRWSLVCNLVDPDCTSTKRLLTRAWLLLERYGLVSREAALAEDLPGGFAALYPVLKELESGGRIRRGYFAEGLSGAQFAHPGAVERLRACRADADGPVPEGGGARLLSTLDPANPYGALLPWPPTVGEGAGPRRIAGSWLALVEGRPVLYLASGGRQLLSFAESSEQDLVCALDLLRQLPPGTRRRSLRIELIDGHAAQDSTLKPLLQQAGFVTDYRGMVLERRFT